MAAKKKLLFIMNPISGTVRKAGIPKIIDDTIDKDFIEFNIQRTDYPGHAYELATQAKESGYDAVIAVGGDGTVNEVVQGICESGMSPELGYIPTGTVNDVAHSLGISKKIRRALKVIRKGRAVDLDCMKINDRYAMYIVAAGAFTSATYSTPQSKKQRFGRLAYGIEGLRKNMKFDVFDLSIESGERQESMQSVLVLLINGRYVAGLRVNRKGSMQDGKIEMAVIRQCRHPNFFQRVRAFFSIANLFLYGYKVRQRHVTRIEGSHFHISADETVVWNFDGEKGICGDVTVDVLPRRFQISPVHSAAEAALFYFLAFVPAFGLRSAG